MANVLTSFPVSISDATTMRAWGQNIAAILTAMGLVRTTDTGTIDWSTVSYPGSVNTIAGYDIWRFNDALQSTAPVFIKIGYGRGANSGMTYMTVEVGAATNGALTLSGAGSGNVVTLFGPGVNSDSGSKIQLASSDGSGLAYVHGLDATTHKSGIFIDRFRNSDGTPNGNGVIFRWGISGWGSMVIDKVNGLTWGNASGGALMPMSIVAGQSTVQADGAVPIAPIYGLAPGVTLTAMKLAVVYNAADLGTYGKIQIPHLGATRTFNGMGTLATGQDSASQTGCSLALWWSD